MPYVHRAGVFFTSKDNGFLDIWDFAFKQNTPTLPDVKVSDAALQCLRVDSSGNYLAVCPWCSKRCTLHTKRRGMWSSRIIRYWFCSFVAGT